MGVVDLAWFINKINGPRSSLPFLRGMTSVCHGDTQLLGQLQIILFNTYLGMYKDILLFIRIKHYFPIKFVSTEVGNLC